MNYNDKPLRKPLDITKRSKDSESSSSEFFNFKKMKSKNAQAAKEFSNGFEAKRTNSLRITKKAQAAMEFLMNYGWALLVALIVMASLVYFGVLDPSKFLPDVCNIQGFVCKDFKIGSNGTVNILLVNTMGADLDSIEVGITEPGCADTEPSVLLMGKEAQFNVTGCTGLGQGQRFKGELKVDYTTSTSSIAHTKYGEIIGTVQSTTNN